MSNILKSDRGGLLLNLYNRRMTENIDDDIWRGQLICLIVEFYVTKNQCITADDFKSMSNAIVKRFPGETQV